MLREKRIIKQPVSFQHLYQEPKKKPNPNQKRSRKPARCEFTLIPPPAKFVETHTSYPLLGGVVLIEKNGIISSEVSDLGRLLNFRNIEVKQNSATKLVQIDVEQKDTIMKAQWDQICLDLESSGRQELNKWSFLVKRFGSKYDQFFKDLQTRNYKLAKDEQEEQEQAQITKNANNKTSQLLEFMPCVHYKLRASPDGSDLGLRQVTFNNLFLREIGYSIDSFVTSVFQEGIPQFTPHNSVARQYATIALLENCFNLDKDGLVTPELDMPLIMKSNYVKKAKAQTHFFTNYEGGNFGIDVVTTIVAKEEPLLDQALIPKVTINKAFLQEKAECEQDLTDFLSAFYQTSFTQRYVNYDKVCIIKELAAKKEKF